MNSYSGYQQLIKDQRHETSFLGDDMLREAGIGEEVECPGNTAGPVERASRALCGSGQNHS